MAQPAGPDSPLIRCAACQALNRVPRSKIEQGLAPVCGKCQAPLAVPSVITVTDATFADQVERSPLPVLVDMWAPWCGPCRTIAPAIEQIAAEHSGRLRVAKLNVDENPQTSRRFQVQGIPLLLIVKDGQEVDRLVGAYPKAEILRRLQAVL